MGTDPDHVPVDAASVLPTVVVPEIPGGATGTGGAEFATVIVTVDDELDFPFLP